MRKTLAPVATALLACSTFALPGCQEDRANDATTADNASNRSATLSEQSAANRTAPGGVGSGATAGTDSAGERTTDSTGAAGPRTGEGTASQRGGFTGSASSAAQRPISGAGSGTLDGRGINDTGGDQSTDGASAVRGGTGAGRDTELGNENNAAGNNSGRSSGSSGSGTSGGSSGGSGSGGGAGGGR